MSKINDSVKIAASDFFGGFFCALRLASEANQYQCGDKLNSALQSAFEEFRRHCDSEGFVPNFRIKLDPIHGDSGTIEEGLLSGIRSDFIGLDNPDFQKFRMKITRQEAESLLSKLPGSLELYASAARRFLSAYDAEVEVH